MSKYLVSAMCIVSMDFEADSFEEAAEKFEEQCYYDIDGELAVTNMDTEEQKML